MCMHVSCGCMYICVCGVCVLVWVYKHVCVRRGMFRTVSSEVCVCMSV